VIKPPKRKPVPVRVKIAVAERQCRERGLVVPVRFHYTQEATHAHLEGLINSLGIKRARLDHNPALALRSYDERDYSPPQHDPNFLQFLEDSGDRHSHRYKTNTDNGSGRGDQTAIAHVRHLREENTAHQSRMRQKGEAKADEEKALVSRLKSRGFSPGHRKIQSRPFQRREKQ
jgi:hypothetical protein